MKGPGKYHNEASLLASLTQAHAVAIIVIDGNRGHGSSLVATDEEYMRELPKILRMLADQIDNELRS